MNITKSRALALVLSLCLISTISVAHSFQTGDKAKKELIIVNVDQETADQFTSLALYVSDLYRSNKNGLITIKTYMNNEVRMETIDKLVVLLLDQGIQKDDIEVIEEEMKLKNQYFTLSVAARPAMQ